MKKLLSVMFVLTAATMGSIGAAHANSVTYLFSATDFQPSPSDSNLPDSVSGSFTLTDSVVTDINLTIGGHTYSPDEVTFQPLSDSFGVIGKGDPKLLAWATDDFWIRADLGATPTFYDFAYYVNGNGNLYHTYTGTISAVPVPSAAWLLGPALIGLTGAARKRKTA